MAAPKELDQKIESAAASEPAPMSTVNAVVEPKASVETSSVSLNEKKGSAVKKNKSKAARSMDKTGKKAESLGLVPPGKTWMPKAWPMGMGEKITMVLRYGPLEGGVATLQVAEPQVIDGEPVMHYQGVVKSSKVLQFFYKIDDTIDSWVGLKDHLPRRQEIRQLESSRWGHRVVVFDSVHHKAKFFGHANLRDGRVEDIRRDDPMTPFAQDVFGALYFYRFVDDLSLLNFPIHDRFQNWENQLTFIAREHIHVPAGVFDTLRFKLFPRISGNLEPKGNVEIWVADNPSKILVKFKAKIKVGSITGELREYVPGSAIKAPPPLMRTPTSLP